MVDYDLMNCFLNWLWKPPWFSFRYYQAVLKKHGKSIAGFLILGGFKFYPYTPCFFVIFLNLMEFKLGYRWSAMACLFPYSHGYGLGWQLSYLLRPSDNSHRSRFNVKAQWQFVTLALLSLLQKPPWPPQAPSASCAYLMLTGLLLGMVQTQYSFAYTSPLCCHGQNSSRKIGGVLFAWS